MSYSSKTFLKTYILLGCFAVFSLSCEVPSPQSNGGDTPLRSSCKVSHTETSDSNQSQEKIIPQNEPLFHKQWYFSNTNGIDINIVPVWEKGYGTKPISVGILDDAIDTAHPDLTDSVLVGGFAAYNSSDSHGTNVAGLLAARDNSTGIIGVAPRAKIYSYGIVSREKVSLAEALNCPEHEEIAVYNASFGYSGNVGYRYASASPEEKKAIDKITKDGFYGKGSSIVFAAGNTRNTSSVDGFLSHHTVITVNAIPLDGKINEVSSFASFSEGANLWITAPFAPFTTDNGGGYKENFGGTSSAAPLVSGAVALLRSEYPILTWRDVKLILAESAKKYDGAENTQYKKTGAMHSSDRPQQYSNRMGFGLLDVDAAFELAKKWKLLPPMKTKTVSHTYESTKLATAQKDTISLIIENSGIKFIESVTLDIKNNFVLDTKIELINPESRGNNFYFFLLTKQRTTLLFNSFLGSSADGTWELKFSHPNKSKEKYQKDTIEEVRLTIRGH